MARCELRMHGARCGGEKVQEIWLQCTENPAHVSREGCCVTCGALLRGLLARNEADCLQCRAARHVARMHEVPSLTAAPKSPTQLPGQGGLALPPGLRN